MVRNLGTVLQVLARAPERVKARLDARLAVEADDLADTTRGEVVSA